MKKSLFTIGLLFLTGVFLGHSQTTNEIKDIQKTLNKELKQKVASYINDFENKRENKVSEYLKRNTEESRIILLEDGTSMYMIDVSDEGKPLYYSVDNVTAAAGTLTNRMYGFLELNTEGQGMTIGVWDENRALGTHQEFTTSGTNSTSRMTYGDNAITGTSTDHATHVAGTMVARGVVPSARGMAFRADIVSYNWASDTSEVETASSQGMLVTNHSYGIPMFNNSTGNFQVEDWRPGCYTSTAVAWDLIAYSNFMTLSVVSAGNEGNRTPPAPLAPGLDKLVDNKVSKNNLVVANGSSAIRDSNGNLTGASINSGSSIGPSDDLRIKPDITGMGTGIYSSIGESNTSYATLTGTSMSAPNVSGSILLLQEYHNTTHGSFMRAATLKGLVCVTADDAGSEGPDPYFGWGILNMKIASDVIGGKSINSVIEENNLTTGQTYTKTITVNTTGDLVAGISWTDYPGSAKNGLLNSTSKALVNDLDIRITKDGNTFYPWLLNPSNPSVAIKGDNSVDNVEIVRINDAEPGVYTITVSGKGSMFSPSGQPVGQQYSLIVMGSDLTASVKNNSVSEIKMYPNPARDVLYFSGNNGDFSIDKVEVYDAVGKKVLSNIVDSSNSMDISHLTSGMYLVKIFVGDNNFITEKLIKN